MPSSHKSGVQSVADGVCRVSKLDYAGLILVDPGVKISAICYCDLLLSQASVVAACHTSELWRFQQTVLQCTGHASFLTLTGQCISVSQDSVSTHLRCVGVGHA